MFPALLQTHLPKYVFADAHRSEPAVPADRVKLRQAQNAVCHRPGLIMPPIPGMPMPPMPPMAPMPPMFIILAEGL